jgi:hypothetical protein
MSGRRECSKTQKMKGIEESHIIEREKKNRRRVAPAGGSKIGLRRENPSKV